ncbi:hypothetical protein BH18CHL2_BH18CHL2_01460 [soil metagenome]
MRPTRLDPARPYKPLDVGNGVVAGTLAPNGRWLSLGVSHPVHGRAVLSAPPWFDERSRRDQDAVRRHRAELADPGRETFGLALLEGAAAEAFLIEDALPLAVIDRPDARIEVTTFAPAGRSGALQVVRIAARGAPFHADLAWSGSARLRRADYTQLTEGGPLPRVLDRGVAGSRGSVRWIADPELGTAAVHLPDALVVDAGGSGLAVVALALGPDHEATLEEAEALAADSLALLRDEVAARRAYWTGLGLDASGETARAIRRGVAYVLDQAASRSRDSVALLADHELLPLVWTRDAYYCARLLLAVGSRDVRALGVVDGFVRWLFEVAERPGGWWPRSSLASGQAKDRAFQLDQQLYPLLLVADRERLAGPSAATRAHRPAADAVCDALLERRGALGLVPTHETPADDTLAQPFHFSSHVLMWRVLVALGRVGVAEDLAAAVWTHFADEGRFAYCIAGAGPADSWHYHDANDLPTAFAPGWGFCAPDDPTWRATLSFAWSERNVAFFPGRFGGLGSLHTPHPWPLGDLQALTVARVMRDGTGETAAARRLAEVETWDGLLPEAYDESTASTASRHWFAWPAALRALLASDPSLAAP